MERQVVGEPYPAQLAEKRFDGTVIARIEGTEEQIRLTTDLYCSRYEPEEFCTTNWGDARFMGWLESGEPFYQLLVLRRYEP